MKKILFLLTVIAIALILPKNLLSQTFTSLAQYNIMASGARTTSNYLATITFSIVKGEIGEFKIKFDNLNTSAIYDIQFYNSKEDDAKITNMYELGDVTNFDGLFFIEYKTTMKSGNYSYKYAFTLAQLNPDGSVNHSTSFYCNKK